MLCISWVTGLRPRRVTLLLAAALEEAAEELRRTWLELEVLLEGVVALLRVAAEEELRVAEVPLLVALWRVALPLVALERVCVLLFWVALWRVALPLVALDRVWVLLFCVAVLRVAEPLLTVPELRVALLEELFVVVPRRTGF